MGTIKITVEYDANKYKALEKFAGKKEVDIGAELQATLEKIYKKSVPAAVREFLEEG